MLVPSRARKGFLRIVYYRLSGFASEVLRFSVNSSSNFPILLAFSSSSSHAAIKLRSPSVTVTIHRGSLASNSFNHTHEDTKRAEFALHAIDSLFFFLLPTPSSLHTATTPKHGLLRKQAIYQKQAQLILVQNGASPKMKTRSKSF